LIASEYEVTAQRAQEDVLKFLDEMRSSGLIASVTTPSSDCRTT
jgi:coenzyme PQQ synthesis protein D (PqqD)